MKHKNTYRRRFDGLCKYITNMFMTKQYENHTTELSTEDPLSNIYPAKSNNQSIILQPIVTENATDSKHLNREIHISRNIDDIIV